MTSLEELYGLQKACSQALKSKNNYPFKDLCDLAEAAGFEFRNQTGSHLIYKHPKYVNGVIDKLTLQPSESDSSKAKPYQIKQVVNFIREATPKS